MATNDGYRQQADTCRRHADTASDAEDRSAWLFLETAFMRLSDDAPKLLGTPLNRPTLVTSGKVKGRKRR